VPHESTGGGPRCKTTGVQGLGDPGRWVDRALPEAILGAGLGHQVQDRHGGRIGPGRSTMTTLPAGP
jgi:hypothetical protein